MIRISLLATTLILAACGPGGKPDISLSDAWARPTKGEAPGAVYLNIENRGAADDRLIGAFTDHAAMAMLHQNDMAGGVARMRMAGQIDLPAGGRIEMRPGGTHIMLEGLRAPLQTGDRFDLVLRFKQSGEKPVEVTVVKAEGR